jgi:hypothetical protein
MRNIIGCQNRATLADRVRFGLIHGFGFRSRCGLANFAVASGTFTLAAFNVGVELTAFSYMIPVLHYLYAHHGRTDWDRVVVGDCRTSGVALDVDRSRPAMLQQYSFIVADVWMQLFVANAMRLLADHAGAGCRHAWAISGRTHRWLRISRCVDGIGMHLGTVAAAVVPETDCREAERRHRHVVGVYTHRRAGAGGTATCSLDQVHRLSYVRRHRTPGRFFVTG